MTDPDILSLAYLVFEVRDPAAWKKLLVDVVGATPSETTEDGADSYRLDDRLARIFVTRGDADDVVALGFEAKSKNAMWDVAMRARDEGAFVEEGLDHDAKERFVEGLVRFDEPGGAMIEVVFGPKTTETPLDASHTTRGFVTGEQGLGHVALRADDVRQSRRFFERVLGFRLSDEIRCTLRGGFQVDVTFLHVNPRHHTLALGTKLAKHLHHFMIQTRALDDLGRMYDRAWDHGATVTQTLGRHANDHMVSFYATTPSGFEIECGFGGLEIDDACWEPTTYDHMSSWGHRSPATMKDPHDKRTPAMTGTTESHR